MIQMLMACFRIPMRPANNITSPQKNATVNSCIPVN